MLNKDGSMKEWWKITFAVVCSLLAAGIIYLVSSQPRGLPITLQEPPTPSPLQVHVSGAVAEPQVYSMPVGSRVSDAITAAGGLVPQANPDSINLAAILEDGQRVYVPYLPTPIPTLAPGESRGAPLPTPDSVHPININTASQAELETLPGIGPVTAQKIIAYREENGPFARIEDIEAVDGIGPKTFGDIKDLITVDQY
jgi:competence protein ComEA